MRPEYAFTLLLWLVVSISIMGQDGQNPRDFKVPPDLLWTFRTDGPIYSEPATDGKLLFVASTDSVLYALDARSGQLRYHFRSGGDIRSRIRLDGEHLAFSSGDGHLYLLNKNDLSLVWSFASGGDRKYEPYRFADYFQSAPLFHGNLIYFGSGDGSLYAIQRETGNLVWAYKTGDVVHGDPAYYEGTIYVGSFDGHVYALNAETGALLWKFKSVGQRYFPKGEMSGAAMAANGILFIGGRDFNLYALDAKGGYGIWNKQFTRGWALAPPVIHNGVLYVGTSDDKTLFALDPGTGQIQWEANLAFNIFAAPAFSENLLYVPTLMGRLYALEIETGKVVWRLDSDGYQANSSDYFKADDTYRDDIQQIVTGEDGFLKMYHALGAIFTKPLLIGDLMVLGSTDGRVYTYRRKSGL